ncbi:hypothetical protein AVEN_58441-1 [Araneus ventricosus]|uniref:Uncharacterized protein n=1 Tax=Araneus ventricosus TaxID=182803 RepID=A0A4Y2IRU4_ARAVE|nr:hypothetical protein AVEN_58441-1 [Araneus ventricosus]
MSHSLSLGFSRPYRKFSLGSAKCGSPNQEKGVGRWSNRLIIALFLSRNPTESLLAREREREKQQSISQLTLVKYEPLWLDLQQYNRRCQPSRLSSMSLCGWIYSSTTDGVSHLA